MSLDPRLYNTAVAEQTEDPPSQQSLDYSGPNSDSPTSTYEYSQENFDTYQHKITELCSHIGLGPPALVECLKGGNYNRVTGVSFDDPKILPCIFRVPHFREDPEESDLKNQIAILRFVGNHLPTATVQAYDLTSNNPIQQGYVAHTRLPGIPLEKVYSELSYREKITIADQVASIIIKIESIKFPKGGRLVCSSSAPIPLSSTSCENLSCDLEVTGFNQGCNGHDPKEVITEPTTSLESLFSIQLKAWYEYDKKGSSTHILDFWDKLLEILGQFLQLRLLKPDEENVLFHWDLEPRNILVEKKDSGWKITGVIDWDGTLSVPPVLSRKPPVWLWNSGMAPSGWDGDSDTLPPVNLSEAEQKIKNYLDTKIDAFLPGYLEDAYNSGPWLRRLSKFALGGFSSDLDTSRYKVFVEDWEKEFGRRDIGGLAAHTGSSGKVVVELEPKATDIVDIDALVEDDRQEATSNETFILIWYVSSLLSFRWVMIIFTLVYLIGYWFR